MTARPVQERRSDEVVSRFSRPTAFEVLPSLTVAGLLLWSVYACAMQGWVHHRDPAGFEVQFPRGYTAEPSQGPLIVIRSPDRTAVVVVQGFFNAERLTAQQWLSQAPYRLAAVFPQAKFEKTHQYRRQPDEAVGAVSYSAGGKQGRAVLLCSVFGRSGMLYAIGAPANQFAAQRPELLRILQSFKFTQPAPTDGGRGTAPRFSYVRWHDPREAAFSIEIPQGWHISGGMFRPGLLDPRATVDLVSPDRRVHITTGDANIPPFIAPTQTTAMTGLREGSWYPSAYGVNMMVRRPVSGLQFALEYLQSAVSRRCTGIRLVDRRDRPDLSAALTRTYSQLGGGILSQQVSVGEVAFECMENGLPMAGYYFAGTLLIDASGTRMWHVPYLHGFTATEDQIGVALAVLEHLIRSVQLNPEWLIRQQRLSKASGEIIARTHAQITQSMSDTFWSRQRSKDEHLRKFSNYILGQTDVVDPQTGETWKVAAGHNYYWRQDYTDRITGTRTYDRPDINFSPLLEY
jgi:hypothetical protein